MIAVVQAQKLAPDRVASEFELAGQPAPSSDIKDF